MARSLILRSTMVGRYLSTNTYLPILIEMSALELFEFFFGRATAILNERRLVLKTHSLNTLRHPNFQRLIYRLT